MIDLTTRLDSTPELYLLTHPDILLAQLPATSPHISLSERINETNRGELKDFCHFAVGAVRQALATEVHIEEEYSEAQIELARENLLMLQALLTEDIESGRLRIENYSDPYVPSKASAELGLQMQEEREITIEFAKSIALDVAKVVIASHEKNIRSLLTQSDILNEAEIEELLIQAILLDETIVDHIEEIVSKNIESLQQRMRSRASSILQVLGSQYLDLRRYFSDEIPNRDYIMAVFSDQIVRMVHGGSPLSAFEGVGVGIGDINSLSVANLQSHIGGDHYIGLVGDVLRSGIVTMIVKVLGKGPSFELSDIEIGSMMRGADEAGSIVLLQKASVRKVVAVLNDLRFKEIGLYDVSDIVNLNDPRMREYIGKILRLDGPYQLKPGEKFGAGVTFAGESFLYALANVRLYERPQTFYEALRQFMSCMLDVADRNASVLKERFKQEVADSSQANFALQLAARAFHVLVEYIEKNSELNRKLNFLLEPKLVDEPDGTLARVTALIEATGSDKALLDAILAARANGSPLAQLLLGGKRRSIMNGQ